MLFWRLVREVCGKNSSTGWLFGILLEPGPTCIGCCSWKRLCCWFSVDAGLLWDKLWSWKDMGSAGSDWGIPTLSPPAGDGPWVWVLKRIAWGMACGFNSVVQRRRPVCCGWESCLCGPGLATCKWFGMLWNKVLCWPIGSWGGCEFCCGDCCCSIGVPCCCIWDSWAWGWFWKIATGWGWLDVSIEEMNASCCCCCCCWGGGFGDRYRVEPAACCSEPRLPLARTVRVFWSRAAWTCCWDPWDSAKLLGDWKSCCGGDVWDGGCVGKLVWMVRSSPACWRRETGCWTWEEECIWGWSNSAWSCCCKFSRTCSCSCCCCCKLLNAWFCCCCCCCCSWWCCKLLSNWFCCCCSWSWMLLRTCCCWFCCSCCCCMFSMICCCCCCSWSCGCNISCCWICKVPRTCRCCSKCCWSCWCCWNWCIWCCCCCNCICCCVESELSVVPNLRLFMFSWTCCCRESAEGVGLYRTEFNCCCATAASNTCWSVALPPAWSSLTALSKATPSSGNRETCDCCVWGWEGAAIWGMDTTTTPPPLFDLSGVILSWGSLRNCWGTSGVTGGIVVSPDTGKVVEGAMSCFWMILRVSRQGKTGGAWGSSTSSGCRGSGFWNDSPPVWGLELSSRVCWTETKGSGGACKWEDDNVNPIMQNATFTKVELSVR